MNKLLTVGVILLLSTCSIDAQVINSISKGKSSFYGHALDTIVTIMKADVRIKKIYIECSCAAFPDSIQGVPVIPIKTSQPTKRKKSVVSERKPHELFIDMGCISIIKDEVKLSASAIIDERKGERGIRLYFLFWYYYQPKSKTYLLKRFEHGEPYPL